MCGRYTLTTPQGELVELFRVPPLTFDVAPRFNVAPGQDALVVGQDRRGRRMGTLRWGFVAARAGAQARPLVNARGESVHRTPSFREAVLHRRCLVPADGFYEWGRDPAGKTPFLFRPVQGGVMALAAIWEGRGFAILTVGASEDVASVHDRMPALVAPTDFDVWLDHGAPRERVRDLLVPAPPATLRSHPVSQRVNQVSQDDAGLVEPI